MARSRPRRPSAAPPRKAATTGPRGAVPEEVARAAMAHEPTTPSGKRVKLTLTIFLRREAAERLTARAIHEGKNLAALVAEILESAAGPRRRS